MIMYIGWILDLSHFLLLFDRLTPVLAICNYNEVGTQIPLSASRPVETKLGTINETNRYLCKHILALRNGSIVCPR